jgi:hypothetical protein
MTGGKKMRHVFYRLAWAPAVGVSLLLLALLTGGVGDAPGESALASSAQPANAISARGGSGSQQAGCPSGLPWSLPNVDPDCDGFSTTLETHAGTLPLCAAGLLDEWPADLNNDGVSDITDVSAEVNSFGQSVLLAGVRKDIGPEPGGDGIVDISDVSKMVSFFGLSSATYLPTC